MNKGVYILFWIICTLSVLGLHVVMHEAVHHQINIYHGCEENKWGVWSLGLYVECVSGFPSEELKRQAYTLHSWTEIVGYHIQPLIVAMFSILLLYDIGNGKR